MEIVIGLGEIATSNDTRDVIKTYALASCVGVTVYSPQKKIGGMIHIVLPKPLDNQTVNSKQGYYATTGIRELLRRFYYQYGCLKSELIVNIFGGSYAEGSNDLFKVGKRNLEETYKVLDSMNINYTSVDVGDMYSRTIQLEIKTGNVEITRQPMKL
ncbi:MAG: cheD1 [Bacillales bacterium]|jgi:chemotaxis protein CheD|nr:cheD1 [Bacillales bacterium]